MGGVAQISFRMCCCISISLCFCYDSKCMLKINVLSCLEKTNELLWLVGFGQLGGCPIGVWRAAVVFGEGFAECGGMAIIENIGDLINGHIGVFEEVDGCGFHQLLLDVCAR